MSDTYEPMPELVEIGLQAQKDLNEINVLMLSLGKTIRRLEELGVIVRLEGQQEPVCSDAACPDHGGS